MKGRAVLSYAEQVEICVVALKLKPDLTFPILAKFFEICYGTTLTRSNYSAAKARLDGATPTKPAAKYAFLHALFTLEPATTTAEARAKCHIFYGEDTRPDIVETWRRRARDYPMPDGMAQQTLASCPDRTHPGFAGPIESFDLLGDSA